MMMMMLLIVVVLYYYCDVSWENWYILSHLPSPHRRPILWGFPRTSCLLAERCSSCAISLLFFGSHSSSSISFSIDLFLHFLSSFQLSHHLCFPFHFFLLHHLSIFVHRRSTLHTSGFSLSRLCFSHLPHYFPAFHFPLVRSWGFWSSAIYFTYQLWALRCGIGNITVLDVACFLAWFITWAIFTIIVVILVFSVLVLLLCSCVNRVIESIIVISLFVIVILAVVISVIISIRIIFEWFPSLSCCLHVSYLLCRHNHHFRIMISATVVVFAINIFSLASWSVRWLS